MTSTIKTQTSKSSLPATLIGLCQRFSALTAGRLVHEYIREPKNLKYPLEDRTRRLMHGSQISPW